MIAVTFALPEESKDFVARLEGRRAVEKGRLPVWRGGLNGKEIAVWHTGVGPARCAARMGELLAREPVEHVISAGFGGGLDPRLEPGVVMIGENFSESALLEGARRVPGERFYGRLSSQEEIVESVEAKRSLFQQTGAIAVDMETETIFRLCQERGIPMLSVRAISDAAADPLPVPYAVWFDAEKQSPRVGSLLFFLAAHPTRIAPFARFVGNVGRAREALTEFLVGGLLASS